MLCYRHKRAERNIMKTLDMKELCNIPARMEDIPLYVKKEDETGNIHIYAYDHASLANGYVKVNALCNPVPYKGRFGVSFTVKLHNNLSTRYALKAYYIEISNSAVCSANDNCTLCPLYDKDNDFSEDCHYYEEHGL